MTPATPRLSDRVRVHRDRHAGLLTALCVLVVLGGFGLTYFAVRTPPISVAGAGLGVGVTVFGIALRYPDKVFKTLERGAALLGRVLGAVRSKGT